MRIETLGCYGGESPECRLTCLLLGEHLALDAGSLTQALPIERQVQVNSILLTHSHLDHASSLPFFVENLQGQGKGAIDVYASEATIYALRKNLFNNAVWPDFTRIPNHLLPAIRFHELEREKPIELEGFRLTPIPVSHTVPTFGFLIEDGKNAVLWSSDTGPTDRFWEIANATPNLQAVCVDISFDSSLQQVADVSGHLTPRSLVSELEKLEKPVPVLLHHLKPYCIEPIRSEIEALDRPSLEFLAQGKVYDF